MGELAPTPGARTAEAEALRRLRSFAVLALGTGSTAPPSLEGLRVSERRLAPLLEAWFEAACSVAGPDHAKVRERLVPILTRFRAELRTTPSAVRASGSPRTSKRRAVSAAIDRVSDAFLAIDPDTGRIADANPAAGALLGTTRDALVGAEVISFVPEPEQIGWWTELDAIAEGDGNRRFHGQLRDKNGRDVAVEAHFTRFATRNRTLALCLARAL
ncbi:MAG: PAS domain-containing protein [bacterium]|nr:PAS domain-containing protein [bacterium]